MRTGIACVFAVALIFSGCSEDITGNEPLTFGGDNPLDVCGVWKYAAVAVKGDCSLLFCSECHHMRDDGGERPPWYAHLQGVRTIEHEQNDEDLLISDHIIGSTMGVDMQGTVRAYSGDFLCGGSVVDESGATFLYSEDGRFLSNDNYESTLALSSSKGGTACKVIWSVTGTRILGRRYGERCRFSDADLIHAVEITAPPPSTPHAGFFLIQ